MPNSPSPPFKCPYCEALYQVVRVEAGPANDRAHIYLADPHGNVMMRWSSQPDFRGMLKDLVRLLKASQIG